MNKGVGKTKILFAVIVFALMLFCGVRLLPAEQPEAASHSLLFETTTSASPSAVSTSSALPVSSFRPGLGYRDIDEELGFIVLERIEDIPKKYQKGDIIKSGKLVYQVLSIDTAGNGTVKVVKPRKKYNKKINIPAKFKKNRQIFQVTAIDKKAFSGCKKLKKIFTETKKMKRYVKSKRKIIALPKKCKIYLKK